MPAGHRKTRGLKTMTAFGFWSLPSFLSSSLLFHPDMLIEAGNPLKLASLGPALDSWSPRKQIPVLPLHGPALTWGRRVPYLRFTGHLELPYLLPLLPQFTLHSCLFGKVKLITSLLGIPKPPMSPHSPNQAEHPRLILQIFLMVFFFLPVCLALQRHQVTQFLFQTTAFSSPCFPIGYFPKLECLPLL